MLVSFDAAQSLTERQAARLDRGTGERMERKPACDGCGSERCADVRRERDALAEDLEQMKVRCGTSRPVQSLPARPRSRIMSCVHASVV